jgi:Fe2+ or Zn2+ uptake regulation protein
MTVASAGERDGTVKKIVQESALDTDEPQIQFREITGKINSDLTVGADITRTKALVANEALCSPGVKLHGEGFIITRSQAIQFGLGRRHDLDAHIREYRNGRDLAAHPRGVMVIDLFGLTAEQVRKNFPEVYQHLLESVKPKREHNKRASYRDNWWVFGEPRRELRPAIAQLPRYIATIETTKHRIFQFVESAIMPDNMLIVIATDDPFHLGILSSRLHVIWSLRAGGWLGVGNDPRYSKSRCFDPFPFPDASERDKERIRSFAEELDRVRKLVLSEHKDLTLTTLYNILDKLNQGGELTAKEDDIKIRGQVLIIKELHEQIDALVFRTYGWSASLTDEQIIEQFVRLNLRRSAEEKRGFIRWLRPTYQIDRLGALAHRVDRVQTISAHIKSTSRTKFPTEPKDQAARILRFLRTAQTPLTAEEIASSFMDKERVLEDVQDILKSLNRLGEAKSFDSGKTYFASAR